MQILRSTFLFGFFFLQSENEDEKFSFARFTFFMSFFSSIFSAFFLRWHIEINVNFFHTLAPYWFPKYRQIPWRGGCSKESKRVVIDCVDGAAVESLFDNEIPASFCLNQNLLR